LVGVSSNGSRGLRAARLRDRRNGLSERMPSSTSQMGRTALTHRRAWLPAALMLGERRLHVAPVVPNPTDPQTCCRRRVQPPIHRGDFTSRLPRRTVTAIMAGEPAPLGPEALDAALSCVAR
jgi:hypothetical protein